MGAMQQLDIFGWCSGQQWCMLRKQKKLSAKVF